MANELFFDERAIGSRSFPHPDGSGRLVEAFDVPSRPPIEVVQYPTVVYARTPGKSPTVSIKMLGREQHVDFTGRRLRVETLDPPSDIAALAIFTASDHGLETFRTEPGEKFLQRRALETATLDDPASFDRLTYGQTLAWMLNKYGITQGALAEAARATPSLVSRVTTGSLREFVPNKKWESLIPAFQRYAQTHALQQADVAGEILHASYERNKRTYKNERRQGRY